LSVFDYDFRIISMRPLLAVRFALARLALVTAGAGALAGIGCANRGMVAPDFSGLEGGASTGGSSGGGGSTSTGGKGGGGAGGKAGSGGSNVDASCSLTTDALFDHSTTACNAMFNFEGTLEGATLLAGSQAFTAVTRGATPHTYCGSGSLAIAASFSGTSGALEKGEVDVPLGVDGGTADVSTKTLTVHVAASPAACAEDLRFKIILKTASGSPTAISVNAITANFTTASASLAGVAGANATNALAIEAFSTSGYTGTIYVDEIDLK
jgi:hypothetical protein